MEQRLIDANALKAKKTYSHERHEYIVPVAEIDWMPTIDAVQVVRCGECKHRETVDCPMQFERPCADFFCADGERKDGEHEE